jgi:hypothetical protein
MSIFICFISCQLWKQSKWIEIRYKTRHLESTHNFWERFNSYL